MLITFSGIVGSGKSTNAKQAHRFLQEAGHPAIYLRFRFLTVRQIFQNLSEKEKISAALSSPKKKKRKRAETSIRRQPFVKLTLARSLGYLWRIITFRILAATRLRRKIVVIDRFYYDNLVHYTLTGHRERFYLTILKKALPDPDLALMLIGRPQTILRRRPNYAGDYVHQLYHNYKQIAREFPNLIVVKTDSFKNLTAMITQHVRQAVAQKGEANPIHREVLQ